MRTVTYTGQLQALPFSDGDALYLVTPCNRLFRKFDKNPLAELLEDFNRKQVSVRYWITDIAVTKEEAQTAATEYALGIVEADFGSAYSEWTGWLWNCECFIIGDRDLIEELYNYVGKYLILEVDVHE